MENDTPMPGRRATVPIDETAHDIVGQIEALSAELERRDVELAEVERVGEERQRVIAELRTQAEMYHGVAEERAAVIATLDQALMSARAACADHPDEIARLTRERDAMTLSADAASRAYEDERLRGRLAAQQRDAGLQSAQRELVSMQRRVAALEASLVSRGEVLAMLQTTCDERMAVIERLSAEVDSVRQVAEERGRLLAELSTGTTPPDDDDRQAVSEEHEHALTVLEGSLASRDEVVAMLQTTCDDRMTVIEQLSAEVETLRQVAEDRGRLLANLNAATVARDDFDWQAIAEEREQVLTALAAEAERRAVLLADLTAALESKSREVEKLRRRPTRAS